jgi:hypothetical protein
VTAASLQHFCWLLAALHMDSSGLFQFGQPLAQIRLIDSWELQCLCPAIVVGDLARRG